MTRSVSGKRWIIALLLRLTVLAVLPLAVLCQLAGRPARRRRSGLLHHWLALSRWSALVRHWSAPDCAVGLGRCPIVLGGCAVLRRLPDRHRRQPRPRPRSSAPAAVPSPSTPSRSRSVPSVTTFSPGLQARQHRLIAAVGRPELHRPHRDGVVGVDHIDIRAGRAALHRRDRHADDVLHACSPATGR